MRNELWLSRDMTNTYLHQHINNPAECGCDLMTGFCAKHGDMMKEIQTAYYGNDVAFQTILSMQDGYGEPGFGPSQGPDWSGVRDSSLETIEAMHQAIHA